MRKLNILLYVFLIGLIASCQKIIEVETVSGEGLDDWTVETHTKYGTIDYATVFPQDKMNRIDIVLTSSEYEDMQDDLESVIGGTSTGGGPGGGGPGGGGGTITFSEDDPSYFACDFYFNDIQWYEVGVRYKGNSSLSAGGGKLPLRFKFDEFEDDYPEISNQRFYGFQHLAMSSNYDDSSYMREKTASELFRSYGVPSVQTAFYEIYVDQGNGVPIYYGLYTMDEVVFDTFLESEFGSNTGNCYKPDGDGAMFASSGFTLDDFEKKTNEDENDFSDIQAMYDALHASNRTSDVEVYKTELESHFDVQGFLKYLAVNNTIQNWDTYANMTHNYYLYHDPADDLIKWIVWDNNEAFGDGKGAVSLGMDEVNTNWPLISYLMDITEYKTSYQAYLVDFNDNYYIPSDMDVIYDTYESLITTSVANESSGYTTLSGSFTGAVSTIKSYCATRNTAVNTYLNN